MFTCCCVVGVRIRNVAHETLPPTPSQCSGWTPLAVGSDSRTVSGIVGVASIEGVEGNEGDEGMEGDELAPSWWPVEASKAVDPHGRNVMMPGNGRLFGPGWSSGEERRDARERSSVWPRVILRRGTSECQQLVPAGAGESPRIRGIASRSDFKLQVTVQG